MSKFKMDDQTNTFGMVRAFHYTIEPFKKFVVGGGWVVESDFSVKLVTQA